MNADILKLAVAKLDEEVRKADPALAATQGNPNADESRQLLVARITGHGEMRDAIDNACRGWASGKPWPRMEAETAVLIWDRLVEAWRFAEWLQDRGFLTTGHTVQSLLELLLIEYWGAVGFHRFRDRLQDMP